MVEKPRKATCRAYTDHKPRHPIGCGAAARAYLCNTTLNAGLNKSAYLLTALVQPFKSSSNGYCNAAYTISCQQFRPT